jgi:hypothetical protein
LVSEAATTSTLPSPLCTNVKTTRNDARKRAVRLV